MTHTTLSKTTDKIGFELISKTQPDVIKEINAMLEKGGKAKQLEKALQRRFGRNSLTASLVIGAAYYLENQHKAN